jgi:pimeloyl-ACP methyl ester carboxylesterase
MATAKAQKDFTELVVEPFSDPDPKPLVGLLPARALADADSKFVTVTVRGEAVVVHYKESSPPPESQSQSRSPSPRDIDAVVCLHGANGSEFSFRNLLPRLASDAGVRAIAFDRPPYGLSSRPKLKKTATPRPTPRPTPPARPRPRPRPRRRTSYTRPKARPSSRSRSWTRWA